MENNTSEMFNVNFKVKKKNKVSAKITTTKIITNLYWHKCKK